MGYDNTLKIFQGNSKTIFCAIEDSSALKMDLTGYTGLLYAKKYPIKPNAPYDLMLTHSAIDTSEGVITFDFSPSDTSTVGDYAYNIDISSNDKYFTVVNDIFRIIDKL